jgi:hypothetical protein
MELVVIVVAFLALDLAALKWGALSSELARIDATPRPGWPFAPRENWRG